MKVAVLTGGNSSERDIALISSKNITQVLEKNHSVKVFDFPAEIDKFLGEYKKYAVAVPVFHGKGGEDGVIQGFLKILKVPFIFSDVEAHSVGLNKFLTKNLAKYLNLLTPQSIIAKNTKIKFKNIVVVKPMTGGSSIGISIAHNQTELNKALKNAFKYDNEVLVEDYIEGPEFTVPVVDKKDGPLALPVIEIRSKNDFFDFESKYDDKLVEEICPASIDKELAKELQDQAIKVHESLGAKHMSRSDFIVKDNSIYFLEINTIPGATLNSLVPKAIRAGQEDFGDLLDGWLNSVVDK
ncbi:D-alanine--D-alanine ligase [bacterium]|nr:D-alanine--D-alanine ligase [bacterium]